MSHPIRSIVVFLAAALVALSLPGSTAAHEHREVGNYVFVVGFMNEPAFEGELNGIWVKVTTKDTEQPVEWLAETLKAQVIHGASERDMVLEPAFGEPGVYTSVFYPTADGDYTFRFFGTIEGNLAGAFHVPTVFLYPGTRTGKTRLKFLGFYNEDGNYRSEHVGG